MIPKLQSNKKLLKKSESTILPCFPAPKDLSQDPKPPFSKKSLQNLNLLESISPRNTHKSTSLQKPQLSRISITPVNLQRDKIEEELSKINKKSQIALLTPSFNPDFPPSTPNLPNTHKHINLSSALNLKIENRDLHNSKIPSLQTLIKLQPQLSHQSLKSLSLKIKKSIYLHVLQTNHFSDKYNTHAHNYKHTHKPNHKKHQNYSNHNNHSNYSNKSNNRNNRNNMNQINNSNKSNKSNNMNQIDRINEINEINKINENYKKERDGEVEYDKCDKFHVYLQKLYNSNKVLYSSLNPHKMDQKCSCKLKRNSRNVRKACFHSDPPVSGARASVFPPIQNLNQKTRNFVNSNRSQDNFSPSASKPHSISQNKSLNLNYLFNSNSQNYFHNINSPLHSDKASKGKSFKLPQIVHCNSTSKYNSIHNFLPVNKPQIVF